MDDPLLESQSDSMVNLAVTMDHFAEQRQLKKIDEAEYEAKKRHLIETYSDDGFESDDTDTKDAAAFNPQLSLQD